MGQQETMRVAGSSTVRRIMLVVLVAALMAAVMAAPAMASSRCGGHGFHFDKQSGFCVFRNG